jgi:hypothetical protein
LTGKRKTKNGSVRIKLNERSDETLNDDENDGDDENGRKIFRKKTPMPRVRKAKTITDEDLDESGIIDRDEDIFDDNDDVSTSTLRGSDESLQDYITEENKINEMNLNGHVQNERFKKWKKFMSDVREKGKGLSCKNADTVIDEQAPKPEEIENRNKSCAIM